MEIIKEGVIRLIYWKHEKWSCIVCGCVWRLGVNDTTPVVVQQGYAKMDCPKCGRGVMMMDPTYLAKAYYNK